MSNAPKLTVKRGTPKGVDPYGTAPGSDYVRGKSPGAGYTVSDRNVAHWTANAKDWYKWEGLTPGANGKPPFVEVGHTASGDVRSFSVKPQGDTRVDDIVACEEGATTQSGNYSAAAGNGNEWTVTETAHGADTDHFYVFAHHKIGNDNTDTIMTDPMIKNDGN